MAGSSRSSPRKALTSGWWPPMKRRRKPLAMMSWMSLLPYAPLARIISLFPLNLEYVKKMDLRGKQPGLPAWFFTKKHGRRPPKTMPNRALGVPIFTGNRAPPHKKVHFYRYEAGRARTSQSKIQTSLKRPRLSLGETSQGQSPPFQGSQNAQIPKMPRQRCLMSPGLGINSP